MKIIMTCPARAGTRHGNRVTALRWARILRELGHRVHIVQHHDGQSCDLLIALHARRSHDSVLRYRRLAPRGPLIVALTGTDLYHDIHTSKRARQSLEMADRLILLQPAGRDELPAHLRSKARVLFQSALPIRVKLPARRDFFEVAVLGHLRPVKDPFRTALALRRLPADVPIRVTHLGKALSPAMARRAQALMAVEPRYRWLGEVPRGRARRTLARSQLLVLSSRMEGGANVISEALADGVPILASRISGSEGLLGKHYPGFFPVGDTAELARLLHRAHADARFYARLKKCCMRQARLVDPAREKTGWRDLLRELT